MTCFLKYLTKISEETCAAFYRRKKNVLDGTTASTVKHKWLNRKLVVNHFHTYEHSLYWALNISYNKEYLFYNQKILKMKIISYILFTLTP